MGQSEPTRQADNVIPMTAGKGAVIASSAVAASIDLTTVGPQTKNDGATPDANPGAPEHYLTIQADGADFYLNFGASAGAVTGANAPVAATTGTNAAGIAMKLPSGTSLDVRPMGVAQRYMGYVASGAGGFLRMWRSSQ